MRYVHKTSVVHSLARRLNQASPVAAWPQESEHEAAITALQELLPQHLKQDAEDMLEGHCEQMAILLTRVCSQLEEQQQQEEAAPRGLADRAQVALRDELLGCSVKEATERVFGAQKAAEWEAGASLWHSMLPGLSCPAGSTPPGRGSREEAEATMHEAYMYGSDEAASRIQAAAARSTGSTAVPLYVLSYIFDADELEVCFTSPAEKVVISACT